MFGNLNMYHVTGMPHKRGVLVQDTVAGKGCKGTRPLCVAAARAAILEGQGAIIDRCNWDPPQRMDFIALAQEMGCQVISASSQSLGGSLLCAACSAAAGRSMILSLVCVVGSL